MKKFLNDPEQFVDEMPEGVVLAHRELMSAAPDNRALILSGAPLEVGKGIAAPKDGMAELAVPPPAEVLHAAGAACATASPSAMDPLRDSRAGSGSQHILERPEVERLRIMPENDIIVTVVGIRR